MKNTPALRWTCYALAAAATAVAMWQVDRRDEPVDTPLAAARPARPGFAMPVSASPAAKSPDALAMLKQRLDAALSGNADPFSDQLAPAAPAAAPVPQSAPVAAAAPVAPAVPFSYLGRWQDQGSTEVFLQTGGRVLAVRGTGPLEGGYVVEAFGADSLTIKAGDARYIVSFSAPAERRDAEGASGAPVQTSASAPAAAQEEN